MKQFVVDVFTDRVFAGNPAAVCVLENWISDDLMQNIAQENHLSETAFAVPESPDRYQLRWFTPGGEIDLCGHATLGTAYVIMNEYQKECRQVTFDTLSGALTVTKMDDWYEMDFPSYALKEVPVTDEMTEALGKRPVAAYMGRDMVCVMEREDSVKNLSPDLEKVQSLDGLIVHVTAMSEGAQYDCVSRSFAPKLKVTEDPVCGSGHCHIIPYWAMKTGKNQFVAYQASQRGGILRCRMEEDRVILAGKAVVYAESNLRILLRRGASRKKTRIVG